jgi:gp16 family phage-associated protein
MKPTTNSKPAPASKTVEQFIDELAQADMTIAEWARTHKQPLNTVYALCGKRVVGSRGAARKVARAMGLALPPMCSQTAKAGAA